MAFGLSAATVGLIGAGASVASGLMGASAASSAADSQAEGAAQANATQRYMYDQTRADNAPFLNNGTEANNQLARLMGLVTSGQRETAMQSLINQARQSNPTISENWVPLESSVDAEASRMGYSSDPMSSPLLRQFTAADMNADPVYNSGLQFGLDEGRKGLERQAAAGGSMLSGATLKALTRFGNDYGSTKANESYNRFQTNQTNNFNRLASVSGAGQTAVNQVGAAGQSMANNVSQNQLGVGNARGASTIAGTNALMGGIAGAFNGLQQRSYANPNAMYQYGAGGEF